MEMNENEIYYTYYNRYISVASYHSIMSFLLSIFSRYQISHRLFILCKIVGNFRRKYRSLL